MRETMEYRDDRMYVLRLNADFEKSSDGTVVLKGKYLGSVAQDRPVALVTYRNTRTLPAIRFDEFPNMAEAARYIKEIEPTCPRISLGGKSPSPTPTWDEHLDWLHRNGLQSVLEGDNPLPHWAED